MEIKLILLQQDTIRRRFPAVRRNDTDKVLQVFKKGVPLHTS